MSKLLITATKVITPEGKTIPDYNAVVFVESDKIVILPVEGATKSVIRANGYQFYVDAEPTELGVVLDARDFSLYT